MKAKQMFVFIFKVMIIVTFNLNIMNIWMLKMVRKMSVTVKW